mmetsp:Transcript_72389/g.100570  ORF Transcript_72389/g.100570 Transcript_72389/m.100570 type:complete len:264 (-) Transcript_72389:8-799(-)
MAASASSHKLVTTTVPRYNWVPDSQRKRCSNKSCNSKFTTANRRHHCRFCGDIFCSKCLSKNKGYLSCSPCKDKTEGKVILHQSKKERKAQAKEAIFDLKSKISAERNKTPDPGASSKRGDSVPNKTLQTSSSSNSTGDLSSPKQQKKLLAHVNELESNSNQNSVTEHTATFSTAPSKKLDSRSPSVTSSLAVPHDDPFSTGGNADSFDTDEEDFDDGDIAGGITNHVANISIENDDVIDEAPLDNDFAAMLAAADDLQEDGS